VLVVVVRALVLLEVMVVLLLLVALYLVPEEAEVNWWLVVLAVFLALLELSQTLTDKQDKAVSDLHTLLEVLSVVMVVIVCLPEEGLVMPTLLDLLDHMVPVEADAVHLTQCQVEAVEAVRTANIL
jgi:hypothetical protein